MNHVPAYSTICTLGHRMISELFQGPVVIEEKIDGSQLSCEALDTVEGPRVLMVRSKGVDIQMEAVPKMFKAGVEYLDSIKNRMTNGWVYRFEYLEKPKHNVLAYNRIPKNHLVLLDVETGPGWCLDPDEKHQEASRIDVEPPRTLFRGEVSDVAGLRDYLSQESILGGQKIEGFVVKNYSKFGIDKKVMMGKLVCDEFKEVHNKEWKMGKDIVGQLVERYKSISRWEKAVQHMRDAGTLTGSPKDIGPLVHEVQNDIIKEDGDDIRIRLYEWASPKLMAGVISGLPQWYKAKLFDSIAKETT